MIGDTIAFQLQRKIQRRLTAELNDYSLRLFALYDGEHIFEGERFEIEAVGGIVVRRNRLWIAIYHDGFETVFAQRERGMTAAIVKFNALPDAVRPAA